jgi:hypothetical protein
MIDERVVYLMRLFCAFCVGALSSWAVTYLWLRGGI